MKNNIIFDSASNEFNSSNFTQCWSKTNNSKKGTMMMNPQSQFMNTSKLENKTSRLVLPLSRMFARRYAEYCNVCFKITHHTINDTK